MAQHLPAWLGGGPLSVGVKHLERDVLKQIAGKAQLIDTLQFGYLYKDTLYPNGARISFQLGKDRPLQL